MVQEKKLGVFTAPKKHIARSKPCRGWGLPEAKVLPPTQSAPLRPITTPEVTLLAFFKSQCEILRSLELNSILSAVKGHLFNKEYAEAFGGKEEYRRAYLARYGPSRALVYRKIFRESDPIRTVLSGGKEGEVRNVVCLGGGAGSEVVALASLMSRFIGAEEEKEGGAKVAVTAVDNCDWGAIIAELESGMLKAFEGLSATPTTSQRFSVDFVQTDVLTSYLTPTAIPIIDYATASLITILFTISELFLQSRPSTISLLNHITAATTPGTLLLVVESASLAEIAIGTSGRTYPLGTLLDHTLCADRGLKGGDAKWRCIEEEESVWYRMPEDAQEHYPLKLENTRVMMRMYKRV